MEALAWTTAIAGLLLGGLGALVPGFPGCAVALLGLVGFAGLTDFEVVGPEALLLAAGITVAGVFAQWAGPITSSRAFGGTAGVATGAAVGAALGALIPLPGASVVAAIVLAALFGGFATRGEWGAWVRGVVGTTNGCLVGIAADLLAVLGIGAVLGLADFLHTVERAPW